MARAHQHAAAAAEWADRVAAGAAGTASAAAGASAAGTAAGASAAGATTTFSSSRDVLLCRAMQLRCCSVELMEDPAVLKRISLDYCAAMKSIYTLFPSDPDVSHLYAESLMNIRYINRPHVPQLQ